MTDTYHYVDAAVGFFGELKESHLIIPFCDVARARDGTPKIEGSKHEYVCTRGILTLQLP